MGNATHLSDVDLLRLLDGDLPAADAARWAAHLSGCQACARRHEALAALAADAARALRSDDGSSTDQHHRARTALAARLVAADRAIRTAPRARVRRLTSAVARWSTVAAAVVAVLLTARMLRSRPRVETAPMRSPIERDALPISSLTPGATGDMTTEQLCASAQRHVEPADPATRERVLRDYGMAQVPEHEYELDYLITPALGGANDRRNLWPERYSDRTWNARVKDQLEDLLPSLVCAGKIDLQTAQRDIAANWVQAYKKYFKTDTPLASDQ